MAYVMLNERPYARRSFLVSAEQDLAALPERGAGSVAHTAGFAKVWEWGADGAWHLHAPGAALSYVESGADCFIDTGVTPGSGTSVEFDGLFRCGADATGSQALFGAYTVFGSGADADMFMLAAQRNADTLRIYARNKYPSAVDAGADLDGVRHVYALKNDTLTRAYLDGVQIVTASPGSFTAGCALYLFGANFAGALNYASESTAVRCYGCKIWDGETLIRDFAPRLSGGAAGLYDRVHGVFYPNSGGGTFAYA